jgi:hypothetical protein
MLLPPVSDLALKEWAVAVKALSRGDQVLILRKGGIHKEDKDFRMVHPEFLLYPTYEHQKVELLKPAFRNSLEETFGENDIPGLVTLGYWCQVTDKFELEDESVLDALSEYHMWSDDYAQARLHWRPKSPLTVALLRVYELQQPQALPILDAYNGCKSWVELGQDVPLGYMTPVLSDSAYEAKADAVRKTLGAAPTAV